MTEVTRTNEPTPTATRTGEAFVSTFRKIQVRRTALGPYGGARLGSLTGVLWGSRTVAEPSARTGQNAWKDTATREDVEKYMGLQVPPDADDVRWTYRNGFQDDAAALTFTGPSEGMETFVDEIDGEHLPGLAMHGGGQTEFFTRLDVQSPEGLAGAKARGLRYTDASTGADDLNVWTASGPPGRTRVWITAFDL